MKTTIKLSDYKDKFQKFNPALPLDLIYANNKNPRFYTFGEPISSKEMNRQMLADPATNILMQSIASDGVANPILVQEDGSGKYKVFVGFRRVYCSKKLDLKTSPAYIYPKDMPVALYYELMSMMEDGYHVSWAAFNATLMLKRLQEEIGASDTELAVKFGDTITNIKIKFATAKIVQNYQETCGRDNCPWSLMYEACRKQISFPEDLEKNEKFKKKMYEELKVGNIKNPHESRILPNLLADVSFRKTFISNGFYLAKTQSEESKSDGKLGQAFETNRDRLDASVKNHKKEIIVRLQNNPITYDKTIEMIKTLYELCAASGKKVDARQRIKQMLE